jgi:tetratricopeptide (TPR) repeat protein
VLYLRGQFDSVEAIIRTAMRGSNPSLASQAKNALQDLVAMRGRFRESDSLMVEIAEQRAARGEPATRVGLLITRGLTDAFFREKSARALAVLDSASQAALAASNVDQLFEVGSSYAIANAPDRARSTLKQVDALVRDSVTRRRTQSRRTVLEADVAMTEGRAADAVALYRRSEVAGDGLPAGCTFCAPAFIGMAYDRANMADSAIVYLERYLATPSPGRFQLDRWLRAPAHKRLGELYEAKGDNAKAVSHYTAFVRLWERADPDMQPKVAEVRARMERLLKTLPR